MSSAALLHQDLARRLAEAEATVEALLTGQVDAVVDSRSKTPVLLATAQEALRQSEERYRRIVETANEGIWQFDAAGQTNFMNLRMARMLGCEADMGVGRSPFDFLDADQRGGLEAYLAGPTAHQMDLRFTRLDGSSVWAILEGTPIYDTEGRYDGSLAMVMDVSERRHAEVALRASEARFRRLWEAGILLITIWDSTGKIGEINDAGVRMLGYSRKELLEGGFGWEDITPKKWRAVDEAARAQLLATGVASPWEKELRCKDGSRVPILAAAAVLADGEGIAIAIDMTERRGGGASRHREGVSRDRGGDHGRDRQDRRGRADRLRQSSARGDVRLRALGVDRAGRGRPHRLVWEAGGRGRDRVDTGRAGGRLRQHLPAPGRYRHLGARGAIAAPRRRRPARR
jgi:PAS domain S-box-containing protein